MPLAAMLIAAALTPVPLPAGPFVAVAGVPGGVYRLPPASGHRALVLAFIGHDCPVSNGTCRELNRLAADTAGRGVAFVAVYADADLTAVEAGRHAAAFGLAFPAILDPGLALARAVGASVKPEVAVLDSAGRLAYRGRIDDRYAAPGKRREVATRFELRDALNALIDGKPVAVRRAKAVGCPIDFPAPNAPKEARP